MSCDANLYFELVRDTGNKYSFRILNNEKTWEEYVAICKEDTNVDGTVKAYLAEPNGEAQVLLHQSGFLSGIAFFKYQNR